MATLMQPLHSNSRLSAAKTNRITEAAAAARNLDAATTARSAETALQNTKKLRTAAPEIAAPKPGLGPKGKKRTILKHFVKGILKGEPPAPKLRKSADKSL